MSADRLAKAKALLSRLIAFDSVSDRSNLPVIAFVEDYLAAHSVAARRAPNAPADKAAILATIGPRVDGGVVLSGPHRRRARPGPGLRRAASGRGHGRTDDDGCRRRTQERRDAAHPADRT